MKKKQVNKIHNGLKDNNVSIKVFLLDYCGIYNEALFRNKIKHSDIKFLLPQLKRVSFDYVFRNEYEIYNGNIIMVKDSYGEVLPYINPRIYVIEDYGDIEFLEESETNLTEPIILAENLNSYELAMLCRRLKEMNRIGKYRKAHKLLVENRKNSKKNYKQKKLELIMKGKMEDD